MYVIYRVYYVWLRVWTNYVIIFKLFGRHKIQNCNFKPHFGSDSSLCLVATQCMVITFIMQHVNIRECLLVSSFTDPEPPPPPQLLSCDEVIMTPLGSPYLLCQINLQALEDKTSTHLLKPPTDRPSQSVN
jgi:hypothetical protein